eukprot:3067000-Rhodomonas_salina.8
MAFWQLGFLPLLRCSADLLVSANHVRDREDRSERAMQTHAQNPPIIFLALVKLSRSRRHSPGEDWHCSSVHEPRSVPGHRHEHPDVTHDMGTASGTPGHKRILTPSTRHSAV